MVHKEKLPLILAIFYAVGISTLLFAWFTIYWATILIIPLTSLLSLIFFWKYKQGKTFKAYHEEHPSSALFFSLALFCLAFTIRAPSVLLFGVSLEKTAIFLLSYMIVLANGWSPRSFGFTLRGWENQIVVGVIFFVLLSFVFQLNVWFGVILFGWKLKLRIQEFFIWLPFYLSVGLGEEAFFRGYIQTRMHVFGRKTAIFLASFLLFGVWHFIWHVVPLSMWRILIRTVVTGAIGMIMAIVYEHTGSLLGVIVTHGLWDTWVTNSTIEAGGGLQGVDGGIFLVSLILYGILLKFGGQLAKKLGGSSDATNSPVGDP
ncbi:MAG: CPBP family intramembrane metalloprotease [Candidatus Korarchaeota archaeon]|nr:CPBP family intramembrane metalloprotease [Candidatus Korarchaeota archaeon]NIU84710.1 CPBP family intramembrane metalloprotease [Candidatus Thorarchaeota archaeon]NIW14712.1 CPBP family intramembrane metalloprotease [Candidatus Thorarchaeota archaeon]NIW52786.1 CPBP family intramembrane metalloprotease [Candidatus Korarchaeota archaeon]